MPIKDKAVYNNALIEGEWVTKLVFPDNTYNAMGVKLGRNGCRVTGEAYCTDGYAAGHKFVFKGEFIAPMITATYKQYLLKAQKKVHFVYR